jgi:uncharacterized protein
MNDPDARARKDAREPSKNAKRAIVIAIVLAVSFFLLVCFIGISSMLGNDLEALSREHPAIEDRTARKAKTEGCALTEVAAATGCAKGEATGVREEAVSFKSSIPEKGLAQLNGTLSIPEGANGKRAAIVLLHGSGPNTRDELLPGDLVSRVHPDFPLFKELASVFAKQGLVVLRYDKRGCQKCYPELDETYAKKFKFKDLEIDGRDAVSFLASRPEVDPKAIVVLGHSEGGQFAPFVARGNANVVAVMMLAPLYVDFEKGLLDQLEGFARIREKRLDFFTAFQVRSQARTFKKCFDKIRTAYVADEVCLGGGVTQAAIKEHLEYASAMEQTLGDLTVPVFELQGSVDRNIDPGEPRKFAKALAGHDFEIHYVPGVNHAMVNMLDKRPAELDAQVSTRMVSFLSSVRR